MLVKCISFIITVFGTKRYKPALFAGLTIVATLVGVNTVFSLYREQPSSGNASSVTSESEQATSQGLSKQGLQKEQPARPDQVPAPATTPQSTTSNPGTTTASKPEVAITGLDNGISLKRDGQTGTATSSNLNTALSDSSKAQWSVSSEAPAGLTITTPADKAASTTLTFSIKADSTLQIGQYSVTIHAKDSGRGLDPTKTIIVTITAE